MIVAIAGKMHSGKTTLAQTFLDRDFLKLSFADEVRYALDNLFIETTRENMQKMGAAVRSVFPHAWARPMREELHFTVRGELANYLRWDYVVDDVRYLNEYALFKAVGATMVRLDCAQHVRWGRYLKAADEPVSKEVWLQWQQHESETQWMPDEWDLIVNTTEKTPEEIAVVVRAFVEAR